MPELREDQKAGVKWILKGLSKHKGVILADRCGLGKTGQAIAVMQKAFKLKKPALIICPAYLVYNWLDELKLWEIKNPVCVIDSSKQILQPADIYLVSYNQVSLDQRTKKGKSRPGMIFQQLFKIEFSLIICDEGHYLKTWNSKRARRILGTNQATFTNLKNRTQKILLLTGTPIVNRVGELYNMLIRIAPDALNNMSEYEFLQRYAGHLEHTQWGLKQHGVKNEKELQHLCKGVMLSRKKIDGITDEIRKHIRLKIKGAELKKFVKEEEAFLQKYNITASEIEELQKHHTNNTDHIATIRQRVALQKIPIFVQAVVDMFEKGEERLVLYSYHREVQRALNAELQKKLPGKRLAVINGSTAKKERFQMVKDFQAGSIDILSATIGALREGINLTSGQIVLFIELDWTPANIEQCIARLNRTGQKNQVFAYFYYFDGGIDKYLIKVLKEKEKVIKKIIGG